MVSFTFLNNAPMIKLLLSRGANPKCRDTGDLGLTCFDVACIYGRVPDIEAFLEAAPHLAHVSNRLGCTPFALLAQFAQNDALKHLLDRMPELFADGKTGLPLGFLAMACISIGDLATLGTLLERGVFDVHYFNRRGSTTRFGQAIFWASSIAMRLSNRPFRLFELWAVG